MIYVRWKRGESRRVRTFEPLPVGHSATGDPCPGCGQPIGTERSTQLVAVGPVGADEELVKHLSDRWYSAGAVLLHEACAGELDDDALDGLVGELTVISRDEDGE